MWLIFELIMIWFVSSEVYHSVQLNVKISPLY